MLAFNIGNAQIITTIAGGEGIGNGGLGINEKIIHPLNTVVDVQGNLYITET